MGPFRFFTLTYWFELALPDYKYSKITLALAILMIVAGFALLYYRRKKVSEPLLKKLLKPYPGLLWTYGIVLAALLYLRESYVPLLSLRIWWLIYLICLVRSTYKATFGFKKRYKEALGHAQLSLKAQKYLPKKKKRR